MLQRARRPLARALSSLLCPAAQQQHQAWGCGRCAVSTTPAAHSPTTTIQEPDDAHLYAEQLQSPNFVQPISINQLDTLVRQPSLRLLSNSATFLKSQLPARLENHLDRLQALPRPANPSLCELLDGVVISKRRGLEVAQDWRLVDTSNAAGLRHFESHLAAFREHLEVEVSRLTHQAKHLTEQRGWWDKPQQVRWLNRMLDLCHWYLLSARVMLTQHSAALHALGDSASSSQAASGSSSQAASGSSSTSSTPVLHYHEPGHKATAPDQAYTPPHQALTEERPLSLIRRHTDVRRVVGMVIEDCRAFCVEKNSVAPDVQVRGGEGTQAMLVVPYAEFVLTEVLKNALQAVIARYGAWEVDDAPPVSVELLELAGSSSLGSSSTGDGGSSSSSGTAASRQGSTIQIKVTDMGNGIPPNEMDTMFNYFYSSSSKPASALYGYSRNHGSQFQGQGVGVPMARVYAHFMGGSIEWETDAWKRHTTVTFSLPKHGFTF